MVLARQKYHPSIYLNELRKATETLIKVGGDAADNRTEDLPNTNLERRNPARSLLRC
jgi:hypothetical protein